jgi:hypothetical protein
MDSWKLGMSLQRAATGRSCGILLQTARVGVGYASYWPGVVGFVGWSQVMCCTRVTDVVLGRRG